MSPFTSTVQQTPPGQVPSSFHSGQSTSVGRAALGAAVASMAAKTVLATPTNALSFMRPSEKFPHFPGKNPISAAAIKTATDRLSIQDRPKDEKDFSPSKDFQKRARD